MGSIILKNAKIYTVDNDLNTIEKGYIHVNKNGKIQSVGSMDDFESYLKKINSNKEIYKENLKKIDLTDKFVFPGFIDAHTHLGICESLLTFEGDNTKIITVHT